MQQAKAEHHLHGKLGNCTREQEEEEEEEVIAHADQCHKHELLDETPEWQPITMRNTLTSFIPAYDPEVDYLSPRLYSRLLPRFSPWRAGTAAICFVLLCLTTAPILVAGQADGEVRLVGDITCLAGRVEIYHNAGWGTVCDDNFDTNAAAVVCRQLGLAGGTPYRYNDTTKYYYSPTPGLIWSQGLHCQGTETGLADCNMLAWGVNTCTHDQDVGVRCELPASPSSPTPLVLPRPQLPSSCGQVFGWGGSTYVPPFLTSGAVAVASGEYHSLALLSNGQVVSWNDNGLLPVPADAQSGVVDIKAGIKWSLGLTSNGNVIAWSDDEQGGWGVTNIPGPARSGNVVAIAAAAMTAFALLNSGDVIVWGGYSQDILAVPEYGYGIKAIAAGGNRVLALKTDGRVVAWGMQQGGVVSLPLETASGISAIAVGEEHSLAVTSTGKVLMWGTVTQADMPPEVSINVSAVAAGSDYYRSMALTNHGHYYVWGPTTFVETPLSSPIQSRVLAIAAGKHQLLAVAETSDGCALVPQYPQMFAWGTEAREPMAYVSMVRGGSHHALALHFNGSVTCWGDNAKHQCDVPEPVATNQVVLIAAGGDVSIALVQPVTWRRLLANMSDTQGYYSGDLYIWGDDIDGLVRLAPTRLDKVVAIELGGSHALVLFSNGTVSAWGDTVIGQMNLNVPDDVQTLGASAIAAACAHSLALVHGRVIAWGDSSKQQCNVPSSAQSDIVAIVAGCYHSLALKSDGSVVTFGDDGSGQLTIPSNVQYAVAIAAGDGWSAAGLHSGEIVTWGPQVSDLGDQIPAKLNNSIASLNAGMTTLYALTGSIQKPPFFKPSPPAPSVKMIQPKRGKLYAATAVSVIVGPLVMAVIVFVPMYVTHRTFLEHLVEGLRTQ